MRTILINDIFVKFINTFRCSQYSYYLKMVIFLTKSMPNFGVFFLFNDTRIWTQDLNLARQARSPCHLGYTPVYYFYLANKNSCNSSILNITSVVIIVQPPGDCPTWALRGYGMLNQVQIFTWPFLDQFYFLGVVCPSSITTISSFFSITDFWVVLFTRIQFACSINLKIISKTQVTKINIFSPAWPKDTEKK
jgi:hypothetical protein